ncbi:hypothetical protein ANN_09865 [Periplaneta americana]|uniref:Uncharacterized protein n=1 Tax=Periplaneta americana TaxID=6978 RepID=A0ABQ8TPJ7_PERAM|nr:hypothetical protein ANN_09865 [Periplaneta americana]
MTGLCEDGNEPAGSLKAICKMYQLVPSATGWMDGIASPLHRHNNTDEGSHGCGPTSYHEPEGRWERPWYIALPPPTNDHIPRDPISVAAHSRFTPDANPKYEKETEVMKEGKCCYNGEMSPRSNTESYPGILLQLVEGKSLKKPQPGNLSQPGFQQGPARFTGRHCNRYSTAVE